MLFLPDAIKLYSKSSLSVLRIRYFFRLYWFVVDFALLLNIRICGTLPALLHRDVKQNMCEIA